MKYMLNTYSAAAGLGMLGTGPGNASPEQSWRQLDRLLHHAGAIALPSKPSQYMHAWCRHIAEQTSCKEQRLSMLATDPG